MPQENIEELFNQSNAIEVKRFWDELESVIGRPLVEESVLDLGCGYPELFIYLSQSYPGKLKSYWGIEKLNKEEVKGTKVDLPIEYGVSIEEFIKWGFPEKFSFINLRNVLHYISPKHDDTILSFLKTHLKSEGIIYMEVIPANSSIKHGRQHPFDKQRYEKYLNSFHVVSATEHENHEDVLKAILKFVE